MHYYVDKWLYKKYNIQQYIEWYFYIIFLFLIKHICIYNANNNTKNMFTK